MRTILKLSKKSSLYPSSLFIQGVRKRSPNAIDGGGFGAIWLGDVNGQAVSIKVMRIYSVTEKDKFVKVLFYLLGLTYLCVTCASQEFCREAVLWRQLHHPNVLPFYGVCHWEDDLSRICLVSPWMSNGNILRYLKHFQDADRLPLASVSEILMFPL
jgi:serine/threonine protein kinase